VSITVLALAISLQSPITLRRNVKVDQRFEYKVNMHIEAEGIKGEMDSMMVLAQRAASVTKDKIVWSYFIPEVKSVGSGPFEEATAGMDEMKGFKYTTETDLYGNILTAKVGATNLGSLGNSDMIYPKDPVAVGGSWDSTVDFSGSKLKVKYRLDSVSTVDNREVYKITRLIADGQKATDVTPTTFVILKEDGMVLSSNGKMRFGEQNQFATIEFTIKRQEAKK
jgi:hypothetical protein